jgi:MFS family permease
MSKICDKGAVLYSVSSCIGCVIAPILGGYVYDKIGYRNTSDCIVCFALLLAIIYFIVGILFYKKEDEELHSFHMSRNGSAHRASVVMAPH